MCAKDDFLGMVVLASRIATGVSLGSLNSMLPNLMDAE